MKRVIFIISELNSGGTQKTVKHLIDKFYNDNFIVKIITFEKNKNYNLKLNKNSFSKINNNLISPSFTMSGPFGEKKGKINNFSKFSA